MLKTLLDELVVEYENTQIMPKNLIEKMHNILISDQSKNESIKLKHHIVQLILSYYVNEQQPHITEQYAYQYLQMEKWTSKQEAVIYAKLGASLANQRKIKKAETIFLRLLEEQQLDHQQHREVLRNLCEILMKGSKDDNIDFTQLTKALDYSHFYDMAVYLEQINAYNKNEVCTEEAFQRMTINDLVRSLDEVFLDEKIPKSLFKYRTLKQEFFEQTFSDIGCGFIYFSDPKTFNDPFDPIFKIDKKHKKFMNKIAPQIRIACLSSIHDNILMWSHYADKHTGICIEYDFESFIKEKQDYQRNWTLRKVKYVDKLELSTGVMINTDEYFHGILDMFAIKHRDWLYEQEYRIIVPPTFYMDHVMIPVKGVYLGKDISKKHKKEILEYCDLYDINVYQMVSNSKNNVFKLDHQNIN